MERNDKKSKNNQKYEKDKHEKAKWQKNMQN